METPPGSSLLHPERLKNGTPGGSKSVRRNNNRRWSECLLVVLLSDALTHSSAHTHTPSRWLEKNTSLTHAATWLLRGGCKGEAEAGAGSIGGAEAHQNPPVLLPEDFSRFHQPTRADSPQAAEETDPYSHAAPPPALLILAEPAAPPSSGPTPGTDRSTQTHSQTRESVRPMKAVTVIHRAFPAPSPFQEP